MFLDTVDDLVAGLHAAAAAADAESVHRVAHRLKGAATNVSGARVEDAAEQLSRMGRRGELEEAPRVLARLDREVARLNRELAGFRKELAGKAVLHILDADEPAPGRVRAAGGAAG